jgi:predicted nucleic acid-binding protein
MYRRVLLCTRRPVTPGERRRVRVRAISLIIDTGPLLAAIDGKDEQHSVCAELLGRVREPRIVPAPVLVELDYMVSRELGPEAFPAILDQVRAEDSARMADRLRTYADLRVGFVDAAVLAVVERLREPKLATLDHRHFPVMRPRHVEALELLPA